jgi:hypothetical protein
MTFALLPLLYIYIEVRYFADIYDGDYYNSVGDGAGGKSSGCQWER